MKKKQVLIPTLIGIFVIVAGIVTGLWAFREPILKGVVRATVEETPENLKVTNITDNSLTVSWTTQKATSGYVQYGETGSGNPSLVVSDDRDQEKGAIGNYFTHYVTVKGLKESTKYQFRLGSGKTKYDQQGQPYEVSTGTILRNPPAADVAYGQVLTGSGESAEGAIVYVSLPGIVTQSALVKQSGSWVIPLSTARSLDLTNFAAYDLQNTELEIRAEGGSSGVATVITTTASDSPVPQITLGQDRDYLSEKPTNETDWVSKFSNDVLGPVTEIPDSTLILLTPKSGEEVNSSQPEIIGKAPAGAEVSIEIHSSHAVVGTVKADKSGNFSFSVPETLAPGEHTVTISTIVGGVVKKISKTFVVQAVEASNSPAFTATPSGTIRPTASPTATPKVTPTATPRPRVAYPATESGTPESGESTPTLILLLLGGGLVLSGVFAYNKRG